MYPESESFDLVKNILLSSVPYDISVKKHQEDNILLVISKNYNLVFLNEISASFLNLCDGKRKTADIIEHMMNIYDIDKSTLCSDIVILIRELQNKRVVTIEV